MILIIERDKDIGESLCSVFREWGLECEVVISFDEAIKKILYKRYEKILIDVGMHLESANWFLNACKAYYDEFSVIVMSASNPKALEAYATKMGIKNYLSKPFELSKIEQVFHQ